MSKSLLSVDYQRLEKRLKKIEDRLIKLEPAPEIEKILCWVLGCQKAFEIKELVCPTYEITPNGRTLLYGYCPQCGAKIEKYTLK